MSSAIEYANHLANEIGPRPAGTEEEQQAALYIAERVQRESGLPTSIEDFNGVPDMELTRFVCCAISFVLAIISIIIPIIVIPAAIVTIVTAVLYWMELLNKPILSKALARGVSQNVVVKYEAPKTSETGKARKRKIIVVARYDSGKVRSELNGGLLEAIPKIARVVSIAMIVIPVLMLLHRVVFWSFAGAVDLVFNVLTFVAALCVLPPIIQMFMHRSSAYNDGANCNAAGVSALMELAVRMGQGQIVSPVTVYDESGMPVVHGEEAAYAAGLVPEGAELSYAASQVKGPEFAPKSAEERLAAAKAALAAFSKRPVESVGVSDISQNLVQVNEGLAGSSDAAQQVGARLISDVEANITAEAAQDEAPVEASPEVLEQPAAVPEEAPQPEPIVDMPPAEESARNMPSGGSLIPNNYLSVATEEPAAEPAWYTAARAKAKKEEEPVEAVRSRFGDALDATEKKLEEMEEAERAAQLEALEKARAAAPAPTIQEAAVASIAATLPDTTTSFEPVDVNELRESAQTPVAENTAEDEKAAAQAAAPKPSIEESIARVVADLPAITQASFSGASIDNAAAEDAGSATPHIDGHKQPAPLAAGNAARRRRSSLAALPNIDSDGDAATTPAHSAASLRSVLPSLSGEIRMSRTDAVYDPMNAPIGTGGTEGGAFGMADENATAGMTAAFAPVGEKLMDEAEPEEDLYIADADDSVYESNYTDKGAYAGPGYVDMPKSRMSGFLGRFGKKKKMEQEPAPSTQEWLDVDEDFEARSVGAARGSWESFQSDVRPVETDFRNAGLEEGFAPIDFGEYDDGVDYSNAIGTEGSENGQRGWQGGEFSREEAMAARAAGAAPADATVAFMPQGAQVPPAMRRENAFFDDSFDQGAQRISDFRNARFNADVWFVALGADLENGSGMRKFLDEFGADLKGSIVIELTGLGAGELSLVDSEGLHKTVRTSSRMKRYVRKATQTTGTQCGSVDLLFEDSASTVAARHGFQSMHLVGMENGKPALYGEANDTFESINPNTLAANVEYVIEVLKSI